MRGARPRGRDAAVRGPRLLRRGVGRGGDARPRVFAVRKQTGLLRRRRGVVWYILRKARVPLVPRLVPRRVAMPPSRRGATWIFRGDRSRPRRGAPRGYSEGAASPRPGGTRAPRGSLASRIACGSSARYRDTRESRADRPRAIATPRRPPARGREARPLGISGGPGRGRSATGSSGYPLPRARADTLYAPGRARAP